jgi:HSP20 family protein
MLMRFDPFRDLDALTQALAPVAGAHRRNTMAMDAYRDGDRVVVQLDLPGVDPQSIDVTVEKNVLSIGAERKPEASDAHQVIVSERPQGEFSRQLFLGEGLDAERVEASYDRGVLTVTVPVAAQAKPHKVEITSSDSSRSVASSDRSETDREMAASSS